MSSPTQQRRREVLRAIVQDYIASQEPVGSRSLVERHGLQVSPATIRNDMAILEEAGLITQPHSSSGRVPTQAGYREFVDTLHDVKPLSSPERRAIMRFLEEGVDLEDVLRRSVRLLAQLTNQAAVVALPNLNVSRVRHCEVVALSPVRLLLVLITDNGRVDQRNVELDTVIEPEDVTRLREALNQALAGQTMEGASAKLANLAETAPPDVKYHLVKCATTLIDTLVDSRSDRFIIAGAANLTRGLPGIIEALEEQVIVLKLLSNLPDLGDVSVVIGDEHELASLKDSAAVTTSYGGGSGNPLGGMGVVGPTYMDYSGTIAKVRAVARYVGDIVAGE
ncbi:HrcA family transcriptional regulator [Corynebacterium phocae]|uniref:Heat-inducible transcription repressor HrcA n=1 Tax=Corynebacterium phocae TaxID=161895 RepID=A0A1L7D664_9CORY|nr:heat-inducible transcriptional repressor HrcA [Corynebacterium phocae]APT93639.1 HrcA family transcriptional regulator [Corynebacterium phocae]KAA8726497.1 heat-inducible transcriptional repressor HrcA [Corynebacterium phocae]